MSDWHHQDHNNHLRSVPVHRERDEFRPRHLFIALGLFFGVLAVVVFMFWSEKQPRARSVADALPVIHGTVTPAAATPGTPVPQRTKPVEVSPPLKAAMAGDGSWLIGKEIKRGTYRTPGLSTSCYWALRSNLSYSYDEIVVSSYGRRGTQTVALGPNVREFITYGCGDWKLVP